MRLDTHTIRQHTRKDAASVGQTVAGDKEIGAYLKAIGCPMADQYVSDLRAGNPAATVPLAQFLASLGDPQAAEDANVGSIN